MGTFSRGATKVLMTKSEWLEKNGFNENGKTFCVIGGNTFAIKDSLKEQGCKFSPLLKWHAPAAMELPEGFKTIEISFDAYYTFNDEVGAACQLPDSEEKIEELFCHAEGRDISEYYGTVGEKVSKVNAVFVSKRGFDGRFGWTNIYTFRIGTSVVTWMTSTSINDALKEGQTVKLSGTIKKQEKYKGEKITYFTRCKVEA